MACWSSQPSVPQPATKQRMASPQLCPTGPTTLGGGAPAWAYKFSAWTKKMPTRALLRGASALRCGKGLRPAVRQGSRCLRSRRMPRQQETCNQSRNIWWGPCGAAKVSPLLTPSLQQTCGSRDFCRLIWSPAPAFSRRLGCQHFGTLGVESLAKVPVLTPVAQRFSDPVDDVGIPRVISAPIALYVAAKAAHGAAHSGQRLLHSCEPKWLDPQWQRNQSLPNTCSRLIHQMPIVFDRRAEKKPFREC